MANRIQLRRDIAADWTSTNPILALGEKGLETDTLKEKVGDGVTAWNSLAYWNEGGGGTVEGDRATITNVIPITNIAGSNYNFNTANSVTAYTVTRNSVINQWCQVFINTLSKPTLTLGGVTFTEVGGIGWTASTDLYLYVRDLGVDGVHYSFLPKAVGSGGGAGITVFDSLTDTPITKVGNSLKHVRVNEGETALEYVTPNRVDRILAGDGIGVDANAETPTVSADVISVNGAIGIVSLDTDDITATTVNSYISQRIKAF